MSKNIIHVESFVRVVIGELDQDGDVVRKTPLEFQLSKLTMEAFEALCKSVETAKENLRQNGQ